MNALPPDQTPSASLDLQLSGKVGQVTVNAPPNLTLYINGALTPAGTTLDPAVPALVVDSGNVIVSHVTFTESGDAPTIQVAGGSLTLRDCTIQESTGFAEPAVRVTGGTLDLGTAADPGGNNLNVNGLGTLIENVTTGTVYAFFDHWTLNAIAVPPGQVVSGPVVWGATPTVTVAGGSFAFDEHPHPATGTVTGAGGAVICTPTFTYSYTDNNGIVVATTTPPVDPGNYTVTATFDGNDDYMPAAATTTITIYYDVRTLTDLSKAFKAGRTIPIRIELTDAAGNNVSSPDVSVLALALYRINADGSRTAVTLQDAGGSNPNDLFRYDASLGGYIFNLSTKGLTAGSYAFEWMAGDDPTTHELKLSLV